MKYRKEAKRAKKASCAVLSGCIAASMVSSASALALQGRCMKVEASEQLLITNSQAGLQTPPALQVSPDVTGPGEVQVSMQPWTQAQAQAVPVEYRTCNQDGQGWTTATAQCIPVTDGMDQMEAGCWYVVNQDINIEGSISINGDVHLILADNCKLTVKGMHVSGNNSLAVYAQSDGDAMGALESTGVVNAAGIGGGNGADGSNITIHGGQITANAGTAEEGVGQLGGGAGIGGGNGGNGSHIFLNGGEITAKGSDHTEYDVNGNMVNNNGSGAGIGGGNGRNKGGNQGGDGSNIYINGGKVTAVGGESGGAGIGGVTLGAGTYIEINDGEVDASGSGAGIGGGGITGDDEMSGIGNYITIRGGTVKAKAEFNGAGIGGGWGKGDNIVISGGEVTAEGGFFSGGAGIGGSYGAGVGTICITNTTVTATGGATSTTTYAGAGIGSGSERTGGNDADNPGTIIIEGSRVTATGKNGAAGIGTGNGGLASSISIKGSAVNTTGINSGMAGLDNPVSIETSFLITDPEQKTDEMTVTDSILLCGNQGKVHGIFRTSDFDTGMFQADMEIFMGKVFHDTNLEILNGAKLEVNSGSYECNGTIRNDGELILDSGSTLQNNGIITNDGKLFLERIGCLKCEGQGKVEGNGTFLVAVTTENLLHNGEDLLSRQYNKENQAVQIIEYVKDLVKNFQCEIGGKIFKMDPGNYKNLPEEIKDAGKYTIECDNGEIIFTVTRAPLKVISAVPSDTTKPYDGNERIGIQSVKISNPYDGDIVFVDTNHVYGSLRSSAVGVYDSVMLHGLALAGKDAGNYMLTGDGSAGLEINEIEVGIKFAITPVDTSNSPSYSGYYVQYQYAKQPFLKNRPSVRGWQQIRLYADEAALGTLLEVDMNQTAEVPKEMLGAVKGRDIRLVLDMGDGMAWEVNGMDLSSDLAEDIDFTVSCRTERIPQNLVSLVSSSALEKPAYKILMKKEGAFGFPAVLAVQAGTENAGFYANLYHIDGEAGDFSYASSEKVGIDGIVRLTFTDAAAYIVILDEQSHKQPEENTKPQEVIYEARVQADGSIQIVASDGPAGGSIRWYAVLCR